MVTGSSANIMADQPPPDSPPPPPPPSTFPLDNRQDGFDVEELSTFDYGRGLHECNANQRDDLKNLTTAEEPGKWSNLQTEDFDQPPSTPPELFTEPVNSQLPTSPSGEHVISSSLADVVLTTLSVATSEGGSKKTKARDFGARLRKIKRTRGTKKEGEKVTSSKSHPLNDSISSPEVQSVLELSPPIPPAPLTTLEESLADSEHPLPGSIAIPIDSKKEGGASTQILSISTGNHPPLEHTLANDSDVLKMAKEVDPSGDGEPELVAPLGKSEAPWLEGHLPDVTVIPGTYTNEEFQSDLPPLPSSPPPPLPSSPPPEVTPSPPPTPPPETTPSPPPDLPPFLTPYEEASLAPTDTLLPMQDIINLLPAEGSSLSLQENTQTDGGPPVPTEAPSLTPPTLHPELPPSPPPAYISPPLKPILSTQPPTNLFSSLQPDFSALHDDSMNMVTKQLCLEEADRYHPSPSLCPGYVEFSTKDSCSTLGNNNEMLPGSNLTLNSNSSEQEMGTPIPRPHSVVSVTSQDLPFQSNLRRWKVTNLAEPDDIFEVSPSSLPSSGKMRRIQSSIPPVTQRFSSLSHLSNGSTINGSLDSISENQSPPDSPVKVPILIQQRLSSGNLLDGDVTVTQVAKTRWSLRETEVKATKKKEVIDKQKKEKASPDIKMKEKEKHEFPKKEVKMMPIAKPGEEAERKRKVMRKKHTVSMNEDLIRSRKMDLYDTEGEPVGEGNLHKLNQSIPKSMSSLFDAVASDIPGLAESSDEEDVQEKETGEQEESYDGEEKSAENSVTESNVPGSKEEVKTSTTSALRVESNGAVVSKVKQHSLDLDPPSNTATLSPVKTSTPAQSHESESRKKTSASNTVQQKPKGATTNAEEQAIPTKKKNVVRKKSRGQQSGSLKAVKVFMQKIHPGLMYKVFLISTTTTAKELVIQGLEKANIIEDHRCFGLHEVYNSSKEVLRVLQDQDCPLSFISGSSAPTHWELRRCRLNQSETVTISTESLAIKSRKPVLLTISTSTTVGEVVFLVLRKLNILKDGETLPEDGNKYRMMMADNRAGEEWFLDDTKCLLDEVNTESVLSIVDIYQYLLKGAEERRYTEETFPDDPNIIKALLKQSKEQVDGLRKELMVRDHTLNQLRRSLENVRKTNEELQELRESTEPLKTRYKKTQDSSAQTKEELCLTLESTEQEVKERDESLWKLMSKKKELEKAVLEKDATISELKREAEEMQQSLSRAQEEMKKAAEGEKMKKRLSADTTQDAEIISELQTMVKKVESSVLEMSSADIGTSDKLEEESEKEKLPEMAELLQREKDSLVTRISKMEMENEKLKKRLKKKESIEHVREESGANEKPQLNLFSLLGSALKQTVVSVETVPTEQGLGVKLAKNTEGVGCVVKTVAETSSAKGILQPGDRLLEVNGHIVKSNSHKDIVSILQKYSGPVQMVVSRSTHEGEEDKAKLQLKKVVSDLEEKLAQQLSLNQQMSDENERLRGELKASVNAVLAIQDHLRQKEQQITQLKEECQHLSTKQNNQESIHNQVQQQLLSSIQSDEPTEFLADNLMDTKRDEILEVLRTVETECLKYKKSFDQLLELVRSHSPELFILLANEDDEDGWC